MQIIQMGEALKDQVFTTHAIAAASSLTLGTFLTYPLDTIKTIIQVQFPQTNLYLCLLFLKNMFDSQPLLQFSFLLSYLLISQARNRLGLVPVR